MFERFTDRARRVLVLAQEEARVLNHSFIGTEHLLLGLIDEGDGLAAKALGTLGISHDAARAMILQTIGPTGDPSIGSPPFTPRAKKVLELSLREALQFGHNYIGTEHLLLGLVREGEGVAAQVLQNLGASPSRVREHVVSLLQAGGPGPRQPSPPENRLRPGLVRGVDWPEHPNQVVSGPAVPLVSAGIKLRIVGVMLFDVGVIVTWRLSDIPQPLVALLQDRLFSLNRPFGPPAVVRVPGEAADLAGSEPFLKISDDAETAYLPVAGVFELLADGEWAGRSYYTPKPADGATVVSIEWQGQVAPVAL